MASRDAPSAPCAVYSARLPSARESITSWKFWKINRESGITAEFITLARVLKTQGRRGEVAVEVHTSIPDRFHEGLHLFALPKEAKAGAEREVGIRELTIEDLRPHKELLVLKFRGVDSISEAETLVGCELQVPSVERAKLDDGWTYVSDLVGCIVWDDDREVGSVTDVQFGAGEAPLLIVRSGAKEYEIPFAQEFLESVDSAGKRIQMRLPEGLLEVNAPLTAEEKQQQAERQKRLSEPDSEAEKSKMGLRRSKRGGRG
ncbi:MAG: hypothetical protein NVS1B11_12260 [Terriglobales bacterium]